MRKSTEYVLVLVAFILLTAAFTWPLVLHPGSGVLSDYGDPLLNTWILAHDARSIASFSDLFQGNIMYPARDVITYSEHQYSTALLAAPVYWATGNPILAYNFLMFFGFVFSAFGMYLLLRYLTGNRWAAFAAGAFFAFVPYKFSQVAHVQICFSAFLPFTLLYLHKFLDSRRTGHLAAFGLFFLAQCLASWHYLLYVSLAVLAVIAGKALLDWKRTGWVKLAELAAVGLVCVLLVAPFALPYARTHARFDDFERPLWDALSYNARIGDYNTVLPQNVLYGSGNRLFDMPNDGAERVLFPGIGILFLAAMGIVLRRRDYLGWVREARGGGAPGEGLPPDAAGEAGEVRAGAEVSLEGPPSALTGWPVRASYLGLALVSFLLAFGPEIAGRENYFYTFLHDVGLLKITRVPARFFIPMALGLAVLGGIGLDRVMRRVKYLRAPVLNTRAVVGAAFCVFLLLEMAVYKLPYPRVLTGDAVPRVYRWLAGQDDVRIIELPTEPLGNPYVYDRDTPISPENNPEYFAREGYLVYFSAVHWQDTVNGYSGYAPLSYRRTVTEMQGFPARRPLDLLEGLGVDYVIWHSDWVPEEDRAYVDSQFAALAGRLELVEDFGDQQAWRVVHAGEKADPQDLETALACPAQLPAGAPWNLGVYVTDRSALPFVSTDEEYHAVKLSWRGAGGAALEQEARFHTPFFVDAGETWTIALELEEPPPPGDWRLTARIEGGELDGREFAAQVEVREGLPDSNSPEVPLADLDARLEGVEALNVSVDQVDGLYAARLAVTNPGYAQWVADSEDKQKTGVVRLALRFQQGDEIAIEQRCTLPCDVSPGQTVLLPVLMRLPGKAGRYHLFVGMADEGYGWFGPAHEVWMDVGEVELGPRAEAAAP